MKTINYEITFNLAVLFFHLVTYGHYLADYLILT